MNILMPQLGETVEEGTVSAWHKKVGEEVKQDEVSVSYTHLTLPTKA